MKAGTSKFEQSMTSSPTDLKYSSRSLLRPWGKSSACVCVFSCACAPVYMCMFDQLSAHVVFMKLSENLFLKVLLDFDLLPHPGAWTPGADDLRSFVPWDRCFEILMCTLGPSVKAV